MYKTRDIEAQVPVHPGACAIYEAKTRGPMCEILVPPEDMSLFHDFGTWGSIMVATSQVRTLDDEMNIIYLNNDAKIVSSLKDDSRMPLAQETLLPSEITGRWLKWYRWWRFKSFLPPQALNISSNTMYRDYLSSHMTVTEYINRLPAKI